MSEKEPQIHLHNFQLTDQDYKNIAVRTWYSLWKWAVVVIIGILAGSLWWINNSAKTAVENILKDEVVKSDFYNYKERLFLKAKNDIDEVKQRVVNELCQYKNIPFSITNHSLKFIDSTGLSTIIEYGTAKTGDTIYFKEYFKNTPKIIITVIEKMEEFYGGIGSRSRKNPYSYIKEETKSRFIVEYGTRFYVNDDKSKKRFNWIAIGN